MYELTWGTIYELIYALLIFEPKRLETGVTHPKPKPSKQVLRPRFIMGIP
jgi:hypothetical protein